MDTSKHRGKWSHTFSLFPTSFEVRPALSACFSQQIRKGSDSCYCQAEMLEVSEEHAMFLFHILVTTDMTVKMEHP